MDRPIDKEFYEDDFEFPLWKLIKQRANEKDISYLKASQEIAPEYTKGIRIKDIEFEDKLVNERVEHLAALHKKMEKA